MLSEFITKTAGKIHLPFLHCEITAMDFETMRLELQQGDVLLSHVNGFVTNYFIQGFYTHAALYYGADSVIESVGEGVRVQRLFDYLKNLDYVVALRFYNQIDKAKFYALCKAAIGTPYDYSFNSPKKFYCSEFVSYIYKNLDSSYYEKREASYGRHLIFPESFLKHDQFHLIFKTEGHTKL